MKTETPPTPTPTIAELWGRLEDDLETASVFSEDVKERLGYNESIKYLRQQLVERLDLITVGTPKKTRAYMLFGFTGSNDEAISFIPRNDHDEEFKPTIEQCKELSAIFAFCGWELGKRAKEAKGE